MSIPGTKLALSLNVALLFSVGVYYKFTHVNSIGVDDNDDIYIS